MIQKYILFVTLFCMLVLTTQVSENKTRVLTVTTLALDTQAEREEIYEDANETTIRGGAIEQ